MGPISVDAALTAAHLAPAFIRASAAMLGQRGSCGSRLHARHRAASGVSLLRARQAGTSAAARRMAADATGFQGFADPSLDSAVIGIMGDLHLAPEQMHLFHQARKQLVGAMSGPDGQLLPGARLVQLGDLGHGKHGSGGLKCFEYAKDFLDGFGARTALVLGNHDLEGAEFETDEENLAVWKQVFQQPHHWSADLGAVVAIGMSTVRYRSNANSHHEVHIDEAQLAWVEAELEKYKDKPVVMFTHAPPIGCGLKVVQSVHVKNRCCWLNHSDRPQRFMHLVRRHPNIRLWFSGHFHLSHNYPDSISVVGRTAYVQTGVIGECNRDGNRQSRLLRCTSSAFEVFTMDHDTGNLRLDMQAGWADAEPPKPMLPPEDELLCDPSAGWLCSTLGPTPLGVDNELIKWFRVGSNTILALQNDMLLEYDIESNSPIGLVSKVPDGCEVILTDATGGRATAEDGSDVAGITIASPHTGPQVFPRNPAGGFYQVYQPNKWRLKKEAAAAEKAAEKAEKAAAAAAAVQDSVVASR